ncbi:hypothetical protein [Priestia megaterium]|uniref:hypothetical protein n=1 Tax=Priestia megaterium TaxID=1404 RepID=UPI001C47A1B9|nr:hypothetical protein [Priestia megaterium]MBV6738620.1 hypothetical protein [Priestia megaterium]
MKKRLASVGDTKPVGICCISCHIFIKEGIKTESRLFDIPKKKDIHMMKNFWRMDGTETWLAKASIYIV